MSRWANSQTIRFIIRYRTRHKKTRNEVYLKCVLISPDTCQTWVFLNVPKQEKSWMSSLLVAFNLGQGNALESLGLWLFQMPMQEG